MSTIGQIVCCLDCGQQRKNHRGGRCSRCYRLAKTDVMACTRCGFTRRCWGGVCTPCKQRQRATAGTCAACGRRVERLWTGGRCATCAHTNWSAGSCTDCMAWSSSIAGTPPRCRACRDFTTRNQPGQCRSCRRRLAVDRAGRCRLCAATRRFGSAEDDDTGRRAWIQLFFGDLEHLHCPGTPTLIPTTNEGRPVTNTLTQPLLFEMFPEPGQAAAAAHHWEQTVSGQRMEAEMTAFAQAHGWSPATRQRTWWALALMAATGGLRSDPPMISDGLAAELRRRHLPVTRLAQFLTDLTGADPRLATATLVPSASSERLAELPEVMRREISLWVGELSAASGRGRPHAATTITSYLRTVLPTVRSWAEDHASLREVTSDEVGAWVAPLTGSARVGTLVALRSLFKVLKSRRVIFTDPARGVHPGRFPRQPVLGLDPKTRRRLLADTRRVDHRLVVLLAGVHALTRADIAALRLEDVDTHRARLRTATRVLDLDELTWQHLRAWLNERRRRWPATANPHLLLTGKSAYGTGTVSTQYFRALPVPISGLRADRLKCAAEDNGGDPLAISRMFRLDPHTAVRYCTEINAIEAEHRDQPHPLQRGPAITMTTSPGP